MRCFGSASSESISSDQTPANARNLDVDLPEGVTVQKRTGGGKTFLFVHNCTGEEKTLELGRIRLVDVEDGSVLTGRVELPAYASRVVTRG